MAEKNWRVPQPCGDCPFNDDGPGLALRKSLRRWPSILASLKRGEYFRCHQTVEFEDDGEARLGSGLVCAGAIAWQDKHGCESNFVRVCRRLDGFEKRRIA